MWKKRKMARKTGEVLTCQGNEKSVMLRKNVTLKATLGATGVAPQLQPPPEMYPHPPPWMSCTPPYMTKRLG
uniref:Uncharacterized protein n=1 Tax=Solanum lycopersicum TaxID=4081 RepID=A0A3Q7G544_SOLLC